MRRDIVIYISIIECIRISMYIYYMYLYLYTVYNEHFTIYDVYDYLTFINML